MTEKTFLHLDASGNIINAVVLDDAAAVPDFLTSNGESLIQYDGQWTVGAHWNGTSVDMPPPPPPPQVTRVTASQAKLALLNAGLLDQVTTAAAANQATKIFFDNSPYWDISHPYVQALASQLGLTQAQINALFNTAAAL